MLEITIIRDNKKVFDFSPNRRQRRDLDGFAKRVLSDKKVKIAVVLTIIAAATIFGLSISQAMIPISIACNTGLGGAKNTIQGIMNEIVGFAKVVLIGMVIFNTILGTIQTIWKGAGGKMSYEEIFGILFKNLCILTCGLAVDKICWWLYGMLG